MSLILKVFAVGLDRLVLVFGAACLVAAIMAQGGRVNPRLDLLTHFALIWLCGGLSIALYSLASIGQRSILMGLGIATVIAALALMAPEYLRPIEPRVAATSANTLKIIQFNAWHKNSNIQSDVQWLISEEPDIIAIEELTPELYDALMAHGGYRATPGRLGTALFTKATPKVLPFPSPGPKRERPDLVIAKLPHAAGDFTMIGLHLSWPTYLSQSDLREQLLDYLKTVDRSKVILVGDFNLTPWSFALQDFDKRSGLSRRDRAIFSWPGQPFLDGRLSSPIPFLAIDHVYAGSGWRTVSIKRGPKRGSDHYPLVVVLAPRT